MISQKDPTRAIASPSRRPLARLGTMVDLIRLRGDRANCGIRTTPHNFGDDVDSGHGYPSRDFGRWAPPPDEPPHRGVAILTGGSATKISL
jgi:hypothetical protein